MKKGWIIFISLIVIIIAVVAIVGGKMYMDNKKLDEDMKEVVYGKEAKEVFEKNLKEFDKNALTHQGIIKSYKIEDKSIEHNPMGGINVILEINGDKDLTANFDIDKYNGELRAGGVGLSEKLSEKLGRRGEINE
ncbi:DUF1310 family protein [Listeria aquatica]|uniref:DUF1310 family protein n=1 Tax=Listeria aquatica TaxID=1494960 RepID=A0A841ZQ90_9LIST|nr:DUF1310 family protein [Listeria aquatica]MBC1521140.1 DUF1310 family protein [Listeria aquatica]